jgi:hypothetical protein
MTAVYFIDPETEELSTIETLEEWMEVRELPNEVREYFREEVKRKQAETKEFWEGQEDWKNRSQEDRDFLMKSSSSMLIQKIIYHTDNEVIFKNKTNIPNPRYIPKHVKREVWRRDQGKCIECGSKEKLEYDHIIPVSKGGSNTARNVQLLCENCNRTKSSKIG